MNTDNISEEKKRQSLDALLKSEEFRSSEKYVSLINYLFEVTLENKNIKESTIAVDCFNKDQSFDPSVDSSVRVYLSKLRKKLEHYYLTEGINDEIRIILPKGHYYFEFETNDFDDKPTVINAKVITIFSAIIIFIGIISFFIGSNYSRKFQNTIPDYDFIWKDILSSEKKTLLVLGDYYFFSYPFAAERQSYIRDVEINSDEELDIFISQNPELSDKIRKVYHTYIEEHIPYCIASIVPAFVVNGAEYELKLASEIQLNDFNKYNIIYIGPYKSLYLLSNIVGKLNFNYEVKQGSSQITFKDILTAESSSYSWKTNPDTQARNDYAMVIKVKGPNKNTFLFFLSEHDFGNISTVKYFTNIEKIKDFEDKLTSHYFEALFEVKGIIRTDFNIKLMKINQLKTDFSIDLEQTAE